jgi:aminoglycoside/choline kinase family phosphotransferase
MSQLNILEDSKSSIYLIAGDASPRKFYRYLNQKGKILVYCKKDKKNNLEKYVKINNFLLNQKIRVPKTLNKAIKKNFIVIEDLGDKSLKSLLKKTNNTKLFNEIIDYLIKLQKVKIIKSIPKYNYAVLQKELNLFFDWYLPEFFNKKKISKIRSEINKALKPFLLQIKKQNNFFVHRDFHLENLIMTKKGIAMIDTQDAVIGHQAYDLASLIDDVRIRISEKEQNKIFQYYLKKNKQLDKNFIRDYHILTIQRLLKILGIFLRLYRRDNKKKYLKYLRNTWRLIDKRMKHPDLIRIKKIFKKYFDKKMKTKRWN